MKEGLNENIDGIDNLPMEATRRGEENEKQVTQFVDRYSHGAMSALFNQKERTLVRGYLMEEMSQGFEHRQKALNMALETRLQSIREACNHVLINGKTNLRQQRLEYFGEVFSKLECSMNDLADQFLLDMDGRFEKLEKYQNEIIRNRERQRLEKSVDDFLSTLDRLMAEFSNIINENVDHQA